MGEERTGEAFELGEQLTVVGRKLQPGEQAPPFELDHLDDGTMRTVRLSDSQGSVRILSTINSLDTPACDASTRRWDQTADYLPAGVVLYTVSMDLPFAQVRWKGSAEASHAALSAHRSDQFGRDYGVLIKEWRLLQRAVFVIGRDGTILHAEYVADQMAEPNYDAALESLRAAG
jgi:thiol peroxidase